MYYSSKTKIVATLGPASSSYDKILALIKAGVSMFRLNTSHGTKDSHLETINKIKKAEDELSVHIPVLVDLQGPKIRVGTLVNDIEIGTGDLIKLSAKVIGDEIIPVDYPGIASDVKPGDKILLDDGRVELEVLDTDGKLVRAKVLYGNCIKSRKGINLPGSTVSLDAVTERDIEFIKFAVENNADYIALSFVRESKDIELARKYITDFGGKIPIIAKIEKPQAVDNLDMIIKQADGIMVARGDLGIEMSPAEVPIVQKIIINKTIQQR